MSEGCIVEETKLRIPQDFVLAALRRKSPLGKISQLDSDDLFWFYSFAQDTRMGLVDAGNHLDMSSTEAWNVLMGRATDFGPVLARIREIKRGIVRGSSDPFFETSVWHKIKQVSDYAEAARKPVFIYGESQIGKTTSLEHWRDNHEAGRVKLLTMPPAPTLGGVVYELAKSLHLPPRGHSSEIKSRVYDAVDSRMVLIFDEVNRAITGTSPRNTIRIMEYIRSIFDSCKCGVIISATNVFKEQLEHGPMAPVLDQFRRRGIISLVLPPFTPHPDLDVIAAYYGLPPLRTDPVSDGIITRMVRDSGIGQYITYLQSARNISTKLRQPINWGHFIAAYDIVANLSKNITVAN